MPTYLTDTDDGGNGFRFDGEATIESPATFAAVTSEPVRVIAQSVPAQTMSGGQPA